MNACRALLAVSVLLPLLGCLEVDTRIAVHGDGSGTITERVEIKGTMAQMMKQMGQGSHGFVNQTKLEERAAELGKGVRVASAAALPEAEGVGAVAVFAFQDLNTVQLKYNPVEDMELGGTGTGGTPSAEDDPPSMRFRFEPGPPAAVTILLALPQSDTASGGSTSTEATAMGKAMTDGFKELLEGMRIVTTLSVAGEILETNATYRDGSRVILLDLPLDELLEAAPEVAHKLQPGTDIATMKDALGNVPGMKLELEPVVRIVFRPGAIQASTPHAEPASPPSKAEVSRSWASR